MNAKSRHTSPIDTEDTNDDVQTVDMTVEVGSSIRLERTGEILRVAKIDGDQVTFEKFD